MCVFPSLLCIYLDYLHKLLEVQLECCVTNTTRTGVFICSGSHGPIIELRTSSEEIVIGKVVRLSSTAELQARATTVCGEVIAMLQLSHPNIVMCKGVSLLPDQPLPVLLMERVMTSLHDYLLKSGNSGLPVERKVSFLLDTASGLEYLHSHTPAIIHRDLTAKNVLLDSQLRAKIADFRNSQTVYLDPSATPTKFTSVASALDHMPPEVQGNTVQLDPSLDVFSFGHLSLFTVIQCPLQPLFSSNHTDATGNSVARSEVERRGLFITMAECVLSLSGTHPLVALIKQCLHNYPAQRPRTGDLVAKLHEIQTPGKW